MLVPADAGRFEGCTKGSDEVSEADEAAGAAAEITAELATDRGVCCLAIDSNRVSPLRQKFTDI